jgi:hypothetical protein
MPPHRMSGGAAFRGQPLLLLCGLLLGWFALRTVLWERPAFGPVSAVAAYSRSLQPNAGKGPKAVAEAASQPGSHTAWIGATTTREPETMTAVARSEGPMPYAGGDMPGGRVTAPALSALAAQPATHIDGFLSPPPLAGRPATARWSADSWLLLRRGGSGGLATGTPSYGRSQAGVVLRYGLAPNSGHRPVLFTRVSTALGGVREREAAVGISVRPLAGIPLRAAAEMRVFNDATGRALRPAVHLVTELPPLDLPLGGRAEAYLQGGYVGGAAATGFIDGQVRVDRPIASFGEAEIAGGAGAWGGAQEGAARIDAGPTLAARFPIGPVYARLSADYRFRLAGDAAPASGPALTLSAGF